MIPIFEILKEQFNENGFRLYVIGGTSRDYLLGLEIRDFDFVTDATPNEMEKFLIEPKMNFAKFGSVHIKVNGVHVDITTLREEGEYNDSRHPSYIEFIKDISIDSKRRDFTINAIYIDENYNVIDPQKGLIDLKNKLVRIIGEPDKRLKEDPLRILRAERFAKKLNFEIEINLKKSIKANKSLLNLLNPNKITEELRKGEE